VTITVTINDSGGNPLQNKAVSIASSQGSDSIAAVQGTTDSNGHATFTVISTHAGTSTITATDTTDSVFVMPAAATLTVSPATLSSLAFTTQPSSSGTTSIPLSTQPVIVGQDAFGNAISGFTDPVAFAGYSDSGCTLPVSDSISGGSADPSSSGVTTFSKLTVIRSETTFIQAFDSVTTTVTTPCFPVSISIAYPYSMQVGNMASSSGLGAPNSDGFAQLASGGYVQNNVTLPSSGNYQVQVIAYAVPNTSTPTWNPAPDPAQWPTLTVTLGGVNLGSTTVSSNMYISSPNVASPSTEALPYSYSFQTHSAIASGSQVLNVSYSSGGGTLYIKSVRVVPSSPPLVLHSRTMQKIGDALSTNHGRDDLNTLNGKNFAYGYYLVATEGQAGALTDAFTIPNGADGIYEIEILAHNLYLYSWWVTELLSSSVTAAQGQPHLALSVDGSVQSEVIVNGNTFTALQFPVYLSAGDHTVTVSNGTNSSAYHNLYVNSILIHPPSTPTSVTLKSFGEHLFYFGARAQNINQNSANSSYFPAQFGSARFWGSNFDWGQVADAHDQWNQTCGTTPPGTFDYTDADAQLTTAVSNTTTTSDAIFTFGDSPYWLYPSDATKSSCEGGYKGWGYYVNPNTDMSTYKSFLSSLTLHLDQLGKHGYISNWELWNEADGWGSFWAGTASELVRVNQVVAPFLKAYDSNSKNLSPSMVSGSPDWFRAYLAFGGGEGIDAVAFHGYPAGTRAEDILWWMAELRAAQVEFGYDLPMINTETNPGFDKINFGFNSTYDSSGTGSVTRNIQGAYMVPFYLLQYWKGVQKVMWYDSNGPNHTAGADYTSLFDNATYNSGSNFPVSSAVTPAGVALTNLQKWLVGSNGLGSTSVTSCQMIQQGISASNVLASERNLWSCTLTGTTNGTVYWIDTGVDMNPSAPNQDVTQCTTQSVSTAGSTAVDAFGNVVAITAGTVPIGCVPVLVQ